MPKPFNSQNKSAKTKQTTIFTHSDGKSKKKR